MDSAGKAFALLLVVLLAGCVSQRLTRQGDRAMQSGHYESAYAAYGEAAERRPGNERARQSMEQARRAAIEANLRKAEEAIADRDFVRAVEHLDVADHYGEDERPSGELRSVARSAAEERARAALSDGNVAVAYERGLQAAELFGRNEELLGSIRAVLVERAERAAASGDHARAWSIWRSIASLEPQLKDRMEPRIDAQKAAWLEQLRRDAAQFEAAGELGLAVLSHAVADALGEPGQTSRLVSELRDRHALTVGWTSRGADRLVGPLERSMENAFGVPGDGSDLVISAELRHYCNETASSRTESAHYLAGTRVVENPRRVELAEGAREQRRDLEDAADELAEAEEELRRVRREEGPVLVEAKRLDERIDGLERQLRQDEAQLDADEDHLSRTKRELQRIENEAEVRPRRVAVWEERVFQAETTVADRSHRIDALEDELRIARGERSRLFTSSAASSLQRAESDVADASREHDRELARLRAVEADLASEPATIEENVWETLRYPVETVTRRCEVTAALSGSGDARYSEKVTAARSVRDESHAAHPVAGVAADPLTLNTSEEALVNGASGDAASKVVSTVDAWLADEYRRFLTPTGDANSDVERHVAACAVDAGLPTDRSRQRATDVVSRTVSGFETAVSAQVDLSRVCL